MCDVIGGSMGSEKYVIRLFRGLNESFWFGITT